MVAITHWSIGLYQTMHLYLGTILHHWNLQIVYFEDKRENSGTFEASVILQWLLEVKKYAQIEPQVLCQESSHSCCKVSALAMKTFASF